MYVLSRNRKNNIYRSKPQFYYIKVGLIGSKSYRRVFMMYHAENAFLIDVKSILVLMIVSVDKRGIQVSLLFFHKNIYC